MFPVHRGSVWLERTLLALVIACEGKHEHRPAICIPSHPKLMFGLCRLPPKPPAPQNGGCLLIQRQSAMLPEGVPSPPLCSFGLWFCSGQSEVHAAGRRGRAGWPLAPSCLSTQLAFALAAFCTFSSIPSASNNQYNMPYQGMELACQQLLDSGQLSARSVLQWHCNMLMPAGGNSLRTRGLLFNRVLP